MHRNIYKVIFIFPLGVALLPLLYIPFASLGLENQKGTLVAFLLGVTLLCSVLPILISSQRFAIIFPALAYTATALSLVAIFSAIINHSFNFHFFGLGFEIGTTSSFLLFTSLVLVSSLVNRHQALLFYVLFVGATAISAIIAGALLGLGWPVSQLFFFSWPQSSFIVIGALLTCAIGADSADRFSKILFRSLIAFLGVAFLFFFHPTPALIGGVLLSLVTMFLLWKSLRHETHIPIFVPLVALFLLTPSLIHFNGISTLPPDIRLAPSVTYEVGTEIYFGPITKSLFGSGPDSFSIIWEKYRPMEFNQTPLWDTTFREGFSTASTWLITLGFFGLLAYVLCPLVVMGAVVWRLWKDRGTLFFDTLPIIATVLVVFIFLSGVLYLIDLHLFLIGAVSLGFFSRLFTSQVLPVVHPPLWARAITSVLFSILGALLLFVSVSQFTSSYFHNKGVRSFNSSEYVRAKELLLRSIAFWPASVYLRDASRAVLEETHIKATYPDAERTKIAEGVLEARQLARRSALASPEDYNARLAEGSLLTSLVMAGLVELGPEAESVLVTASAFSPNRPDAPYVQAMLAHALGSSTQAHFYIQEALRRKPDYQEAKTLFDQLGEDENLP